MSTKETPELSSSDFSSVHPDCQIPPSPEHDCQHSADCDKPRHDAFHPSTAHPIHNASDIPSNIPPNIPTFPAMEFPAVESVRPRALKEQDSASPSLSRKSQAVTLNPEILFSFQRYSPSTKSSTEKHSKAISKFVPGRYIRAAHRLYVLPTADVVDLLKHPDVFVEWDIVVKVEVLSFERSDLLTCPICLDENFAAPRVARCGHTFCFDCILRTFNEQISSDLKTRCPVCSEPMQLNHLKPARFQIATKTEINNKVSFCLMAQNSPDSIVLPSSSPDILSSLSSNHPGVLFHRLALLDSSDERLAEDLIAMEVKRKEMESLGEAGAVTAIEECIRTLLLSISDSASQSSDSRPTNMTQTPKTARECHLQFNLSVADPAVTLAMVEDHQRLPTPAPQTSPPGPDKPFLSRFYQLADGQLVFMDELCMACLIHEAQHGASEGASPAEEVVDGVTPDPCVCMFKAEDSEVLGNLPVSIRDCTVIWKEVEVVDGLFRKRHPYLRHLARGSVVSFLDFDVQSLVSAGTFGLFREALEQRRRRREDARKRQEKRDEEKAAEFEAFHSTHVQLRLLEESLLSDSRSDPVDLSTGLLLEKITADHSYFPPLEEEWNERREDERSEEERSEEERKEEERKEGERKEGEKQEEQSSWSARINPFRNEMFPSLGLSPPPVSSWGAPRTPTHTSHNTHPSNVSHLSGRSPVVNSRSSEEEVEDVRWQAIEAALKDVDRAPGPKKGKKGKKKLVLSGTPDFRL